MAPRLGLALPFVENPQGVLVLNAGIVYLSLFDQAYPPNSVHFTYPLKLGSPGYATYL